MCAIFVDKVLSIGDRAYMSKLGCVYELFDSRFPFNLQTIALSKSTSVPLWFATGEELNLSCDECNS